MKLLDSITDSVEVNLRKLDDNGGKRSLVSTGLQRVRQDLVTGSQQ